MPIQGLPVAGSAGALTRSCSPSPSAASGKTKQLGSLYVVRNGTADLSTEGRCSGNYVRVGGGTDSGPVFEANMKMAPSLNSESSNGPAAAAPDSAAKGP